MYPDSYQNKEDDEAVYWFSSPYDPLNNWSAHTVQVDGRVFHTLEHAYHFAKFTDDNVDIANQIANAPSPWAAMQVVRKNSDKIRKDWSEIKVEIMEKLVRLKHEQNEDVRIVLAKSGNRKIVENSPWDDFWGVGEDGNGRNMMGLIWMKVRDGK